MLKLDKKVQEKLIELGVEIVYLFGSRTQNTETAFSDVDIGIVFSSTIHIADFKNIQKKYGKLCDIFSQIYKPTFNKEIDLVFLQQTSIILQHQAISKGKIIFQTSAEFTADYEEKVTEEYLDFKPVLNYIDQIMLKRIA